MTKKPILIQVAMEVECQNLLKVLDKFQKKEYQSYQFYEGEIAGYPIIISLSKVGLIHASASLSLAITLYQPIAIINYGIAGATTPNLHIKDIVVGKNVININSYKTAPRAKLNGSNPNDWELLTFLSGKKDRLIIEEAHQDLLTLLKEIPTPLSKNIYYGTIGSGDVWNQEIDRLLFLNEKHQILCEDMESIATYTLANQWEIPVISLKIISDNSIIGEEYDRTVGKTLEEYILEYLKILIKNLK